MRSTASYNAAIDNLNRMIDEAEKSIAAMEAGELKLFDYSSGQQVDETASVIERNKRKVGELQALIEVISEKKASDHGD